MSETKSKVNPIPEDFKAATPYIICKDAAKAIEFYKKAFGAKEMFRMNGPDGKVGHAEIRIGKHAMIMMCDENPKWEAVGPNTLGGTPVSIYIYVEDVDAFAKQAEKAGATILRPVANQFYGDRNVSLKDPFGHKWGFATHVEDLSPEEMNRRTKEAFAHA